MTSSARGLPAQGVLLGVDYGLARLGLAKCDPLRLIATPLRVMRTQGRHPRLVAEELAACARETESVGFVFGWPDENDKRTCLVRDAITVLVTELRARGFACASVPEDFSSRDALDLLHEARKKKKALRGDIDAYAAAVILERYLGE